MNIALLNQAKDTRITDEVIQRLCAAWTNQLVDYCRTYGKAPIEVRPGNNDSSGAKLYIFDNTDVAGDLGYHTTDGDGRPFGCIFTSGLELFTTPNSVSVVGSHEVLEMSTDPPANMWAEDPWKRKWALEPCDPCQEEIYNDSLTGVAVSDFVKPEFFNTAYKGTDVDWLGRLPGPFTVSPNGGYAVITMPNGTRLMLPQGLTLDKLSAKKSHPSSRTYRRLFGL